MRPTVHRHPTPHDWPPMLALNNAFAVETSALSQATLAALITSAMYVRVSGSVDAFIIALDQDAGYENANFSWFRARFGRFVYIDRIIVASHARGQRLGQELYADLVAVAKVAGQTTLCCEVNIDPPNPASDRFHAALGFVEVGRARLPHVGKTVAYLTLAV